MNMIILNFHLQPRHNLKQAGLIINGIIGPYLADSRRNLVMSYLGMGIGPFAMEIILGYLLKATCYDMKKM